jgi:hypothetical protein
VYILSPRVFRLGTSGLCMLCFHEISPLLFTRSLSPCSPIVQELVVHRGILFSSVDVSVFFHSLVFSIYPSPPVVPSDLRIQSCSLFHLYVCGYDQRCV